MPIQSFANRETAAVFAGKEVRKTPPEIQKLAKRKMCLLDAANFIEDLCVPPGITQYRLAKSIDVPPQRIGAIVSDGRAITADTDLRLCHFFQISEGFFLRL